MEMNENHILEDFINSQVINRGLDERTAIAYRMDLENFYLWAETLEGIVREEQMEAYLEYLSKEKGLRYSTISRKQKVFGYYLSYLAARGLRDSCRPLKLTNQQKEDLPDKSMSKKEIDAFFQAMDREYHELDSDFRRRVCLRDQIIMKFLFYHGIEISEILQMKLSDYDQKTTTLTVHKKHLKERGIYVFSRTLQQQLKWWISEHINFEHMESYHNYMFLSKMGRPLSMKMVINIFDKYRIMAGIEKKCTPKDLKNSLGKYAEEVVRERG